MIGLGLQWEYVRSLVLQGEVWRLLTASLTHTNVNHLLLNAGALAALLTIAHRLGKLRAAFIALPVACVLSNAMLLLFPSLIWYCGLSGGLYGLAAFLIVGMLAGVQHRRLGIAALIVLLAKCLSDVLGNSEPVSMLIDARVAWEAHVTGVAAGLAMGASAHFFRLFMRPPTATSNSLLQKSGPIHDDV